MNKNCKTSDLVKRLCQLRPFHVSLNSSRVVRWLSIHRYHKAGKPVSMDTSGNQLWSEPRVVWPLDQPGPEQPRITSNTSTNFPQFRRVGPVAPLFIWLRIPTVTHDNGPSDHRGFSRISPDLCLLGLTRPWAVCRVWPQFRAVGSTLAGPGLWSACGPGNTSLPQVTISGPTDPQMPQSKQALTTIYTLR